MVYKNKGGQPREKVMVAAYWLVAEAGAKQSDVARALGCSQPTIASWVKEVGFRNEIQGLQREIEDAREYAEQLQNQISGYIEHVKEN